MYTDYTDLPSASVTRFGSVSAALMNVNSPIIPNWSVTMPFGIFEIIPDTTTKQKHAEEKGKRAKTGDGNWTEKATFPRGQLISIL